jgi:hypothetical protein
MGVAQGHLVQRSLLQACGPTVHRVCGENVYAKGSCLLLGAHLQIIRTVPAALPGTSLGDRDSVGSTRRLSSPSAAHCSSPGGLRWLYRASESPGWDGSTLWPGEEGRGSPCGGCGGCSGCTDANRDMDIPELLR